MENKKTKSKKTITKPIKKTYKVMRILHKSSSKIRKLKKRNYTNNRNKNIPGEDRERKKE